MDEFEYGRSAQNENGADGTADVLRNEAAEAAAEEERTDDLNGASSENGYVYQADGTYGYTRPAASQPEAGAAFGAQTPPSGEPFSASPADGAQQPWQTGGQSSYQNTAQQTWQTGGQQAYQNTAQQTWQTGGQSPYQNNAQYPYQSGGANNASPYRNDPYHNRQQEYAYPESGGGKKKSSGGKIFGIVTGALCVVLIALLVAVIVSGGKNKVSVNGSDGTSSAAEQNENSDNVDELVTAESPEAVGKTGSKGEMTPKEIYRKVLASSVGILVYNQSDSLASEGTGVLFQEDNDGKYTYIITCAHVISGNKGTVMVQLHDEKQYKAEIVGFDTRTDIGVLKIEETGLTLAEIGDSSKLAVGDNVYAIGNPGGVEFANSFTGGMISALDRPVNSSASGYTMECIQHTAAINPGNSGGALVNVFGQVIGINSMKIVDDEYEGMGFSVPSSVFVDIVNNIIAHGYVANRPKLGITYVAAQNYNSYGMFVAIKELPKGSIVIYSIADDSTLKGTKAQEGDMIVAVNGKDLDDSSYLPELIEKSNVGDEITLSLIRINRDYSFEEFNVTVKLVEDRGDTVIEQESTTDQRDEYGDYFGDYFDDYFKDYFGDFFR